MASKKKNEAENVSAADLDIPEGFDDLENARVDLDGFYSPKEDQLAPGGDHVFGTLVKYAARKKNADANKRKAEGFLIVILARDVVGLVYDDEAGDERGTEGVLPAGAAVGIDIRGAYRFLSDRVYEGKKIHLHFRGKRNSPSGDPFWDVGVRVQGGIVPASQELSRAGHDSRP